MNPVESGKVSLVTRQQREIIILQVILSRALAAIDHGSHTREGQKKHRLAVANVIQSQPLIRRDRLDTLTGPSPTAILDLSPMEAAGIIAEMYVNLRTYTASQETAMIRSFRNCVMQSPEEVAKQLSTLQQRIGLHSQSSHVLDVNFLTQTMTPAHSGTSDHLFVAFLQDLVSPIVAGLAARMTTIAGDAFIALKKPENQKMLSSFVCWHFYDGKCRCADHAERMGRQADDPERMGRQKVVKCHPSHSIHNWDPQTQPLRKVLFSAITGISVDKLWLPAVPSELLAFSIANCRSKTNAFRYGMALWQVGEHLELDEPLGDEDEETQDRPRARRRRKGGQSMDPDAAPRKRGLVSLREARVHPVLICSRQGCKQLVGPDNACACTRTRTHKWPLAKKPTFRIYADEADAELRLRDVFRVQPAQEGGGCRHSEKDGEHSLKEAPLLFPVGGPRTCPECGKNMTGKATVVYVPGLDSDASVIERESPEVADDIPDALPVRKLVRQLKAQFPRNRNKKIRQLIEKYEALCKSEPTRWLLPLELLELLRQTKEWNTFPRIEAAVRHHN